MDNNNNNGDKNKGLFRLMLPVIIVLVAVIGYFIYEGFFAGGSDALSPSTNTYLIGTRLGKDVDIINKENLSFSTNINNQSLKQDNSSFEVVTPSTQVGRANPFLP
jgi:hypothetical protein